MHEIRFLLWLVLALIIYRKKDEIQKTFGYSGGHPTAENISERNLFKVRI
jgi:hypothetical protein